ncbi:hypothetical protein G5V58_07900 [Nocardioides anomalus]|uniref:Bacterial sugar transferase domain-containing protein n=1 Tax=Nocardioides anomalus TaxID=2712223 RepID=A0A6G6W804_9ACTN|nr:hypothetical protein [Nocardioides anomalus]QIG41354.1 hypothetical protein G5V58_07900 [Nocardioides anomalus]
MRARVPGRARLATALAAAQVPGVLLAGALAGESLVPALAATAVALAVAWAADLHRPRLVLAVTADLPGLLLAAGAATLTLLALGGATWSSAPLALAGLVLGHTLVLGGALLLRRTGRLGRRVLVVGTGREARRLGATLLGAPGLGLRPVGFVAATDPLDPTRARGLPGPLLGTLTTLPRAMAEARADAVVLAHDGPLDAAALEGLLASGAELYAGPEAARTAPGHVRPPAELVDGLPLVRLERRAAPAPVRVVRRVAEALVALVALAVLLPLTVVLGVLAKLETGGVLVATDGGIRFRTRRPRSVGRPGPVGRVLRRSHADALPEAVAGWARRLRKAGGAAPVPSAPPALTHQAQVDAGQLAS